MGSAGEEGLRVDVHICEGWGAGAGLGVGVRC